MSKNNENYCVTDLIQPLSSLSSKMKFVNTDCPADKTLNTQAVSTCKLRLHNPAVNIFNCLLSCVFNLISAIIVSISYKWRDKNVSSEFSD